MAGMTKKEFKKSYFYCGPIWKKERFESKTKNKSQKWYDVKILTICICGGVYICGSADQAIFFNEDYGFCLIKMRICLCSQIADFYENFEQITDFCIFKVRIAECQ